MSRCSSRETYKLDWWTILMHARVADRSPHVSQILSSHLMASRTRSGRGCRRWPHECQAVYVHVCTMCIFLWLVHRAPVSGDALYIDVSGWRGQQAVTVKYVSLCNTSYRPAQHLPSCRSTPLKGYGCQTRGACVAVQLRTKADRCW